MKQLTFALILYFGFPSFVFSQSAAKQLEYDLGNIPAGYNAATKRYETISQAIFSFNFLTKKCGTEKQYKELFELTPKINGAATMEHIGEVNALALMTCPDSYLSALKLVNEEEIAASVGAMGITLPPWEVAEAIYSYLDKPRFKDLMDKYFRNWVIDCTYSNGKAKVGCNFANN